MYKKFFKRCLDILFSFFALPLILLIIVIMAPIIYINDPGPVFYNGIRRGVHRKTFKMFKFRSMYMDSPDLRNSDGSTFNSNNDPRVTKVGRFMRKTSIDEIPQIINILIGDMSFIGPRPALASKPYDELNELSKARLSVRPGITGYAQAYYRNSISQEEKFKYDCYYIDKMSFLLDIKILIQTIKSVIARDNIYVASESKNNINEKKIDEKTEVTIK